MPVALPASRQSPVPAQPIGSSSASEKADGKYSLTCFLSSFVFALALALLHNFCWADLRIALATDGKHYLTTIQKFVETFSSSNYADLFGGAGPCAHLLLDGPLLAIMYVPVFLLTGHVPGPRDWGVLAQGQSLVHALSAGVVSLLVLRLVRNPFWALAAGFIFAAYPPAILQTGHFMTETPAALLCLLLVLSLSSVRRSILAALCAGTCSGLLFVAKPALIPAVVLSLFYGCMQFEQRKKAFISATASFLVTVACWSALSCSVTGVPSVTAQRQPIYNVAKAWNVEFDGWGCNPHPVLTDLNCQTDSALPIVYAMWQTHPVECMQLTARKVTRLFALPWNDFKNRALGVDMNGQIFWHQLLLCSGLYGALLLLFARYRSLSPVTRLPAELSIILIVGHLTYLLVESTARYAFTSVPLFVVLALGGTALSGSQQPSERQRPGGVLAALIGAMLITSLIVHFEKITKRDDPKNLKELSHVMTFGQRAEKTIDLSEVSSPTQSQTVLVLIDGDKYLEQCELSLNGKRISKPILPLCSFDGPHYNLYDQMREFGPSMGVDPEEFRQWRAVEVDKDLIDWHGKNKIELFVRPAAATIYGDANVNSRYMLSPDYFSYGLVSSAPAATGAESRCVDPVIAGAPRQSSRILSGSRAERLFDSLRIKLVCVLPPPVKASDPAAQTVNVPNSTRFGIAVAPNQFDPMLQEGNQVRINKSILYNARSIAASVQLPDRPSTETHLSLRISGEARALRNPGETGVLVALTGKNGEVQTLGRLPRSVPVDAQWSKFAIIDTVPLSVIGNKPDKLALALYPVPWMQGQYGASRKDPDAAFRNLHIEGEYTTLPGVAGARLIVY